MTPPPIIEGIPNDPKICTNCGEQRHRRRLCTNCGYHTGAFRAPSPLEPKERRINTVLRRIYDAMFKSGVLKRNE